MCLSGGYKKSIAILVTGRGGLWDCEMSRIPHCVDLLITDGGEFVSITLRMRFTARKIFWYSFLLEAE
jgi:hypothetical protein